MTIESQSSQETWNRVPPAITQAEKKLWDRQARIRLSKEGRLNSDGTVPVTESSSDDQRSIRQRAEDWLQQRFTL